MITIGVIGSRGKSAVAEILQEELKKQGKTVCIIGINFSKSDCSYRENSDIDYSIMTISRENILNEEIERGKFDILLQTTLEEESDELIDKLQTTINIIKEDGYFVFNSDSIQNINFKCDSIYPVTYGLNGRTTITTSSIDDMEELCFMYCSQRSIINIIGKVIQPFEKSVSVKGKYYDINYYLCAYTCLLILGYNF